MSSQRVVDVAIIGGGLSGVTLALAVQSLGLTVVLIEAKSLPQPLKKESDFDRRSLALSYGTSRIFQEMGVWPSLLPVATPINNIHVSDRGHTGSVRLSAQAEKVPALGYVIELSILMKVLWDQLQQTSVLCLCPAQVTDLQNYADHAMLTVQSLEETISLRANWVVCADGADSEWRQQLSMTVVEQEYGQVAVVANIGLKRDHANIAYERFTASGPLALLPLSGQVAALVWTVNPAQVPELLQCSDGEFLQRLQQTFGYRLGRFERVGQRQAFPLKLVKVDKLYHQRTVLLGSAAHHLHPIAGQGFNLTMRDIAGLRALFAADSHNVAERYQQLRGSDQQRTIAITDSLVKCFSSSLLPFTPLRNLALMELERTPILKTRLNRVMMGVGSNA